MIVGQVERLNSIIIRQEEEKMKLSCLPVSLFSELSNGKMTIKQWAHLAKEAGLDAIDLSIVLLENHTPVYLNKVREDLKTENMSIKMLTTYPDFSHPDCEQRERELEYLRHDIALCSNLDIDYLRIVAGQAHPETKLETGIKNVVEYFKKADQVAQKYGVKLLYENHYKPGAWDYVDFSYRTEVFLKIVEGIKNTNIGINFDTANTVACGDDPVPVLKIILDKLETLHLSENKTYGEFKPVLLGKGVVPFEKIFKILKEEKFNGWFSIEEASFTGIEGINEAVKFARNLWNSID
jgi:sugar phosphate isomerase/epimerase